MASQAQKHFFFRDRLGVTLPEMLISMVIMVLIVGVVSILYFTSLHVWRRCSSQSQADPPAHMSVSRLSRELKNAAKIEGITESSITFTLPGKDENGYNIVPLTAAQRIYYFLGDEEGNPNSSGSTLWRQRIDLSSGNTTLQSIAHNVESLNFEVDATEDRVLKIYAMSVTIVGREGREEYRSQFESHIAMRN